MYHLNVYDWIGYLTQRKQFLLPIDIDGEYHPKNAEVGNDNTPATWYH